MLFKRLIILLFTSLFFWSNHILVQANEGEAFNEKLIGKDNYVYPYLETRNDAGIFYDFSWNTKEKSIYIKRNENNYPVVRFSLFNKDSILPGTAIKSFNDIDLSKLKDDKILELSKNSGTVNLELFKSGNLITIESKPYKYNNFKLLNFDLHSINEIDTKRGMFEISFEAVFSNTRLDLLNDAKEILKDELYDIFQELRDKGFPVPIEYISLNEYKIDDDIRDPLPAQFSYDNEIVRTIMTDTGVGQFRSDFDFRKFPFDTQTLKMAIKSGHRSTSNPNFSWPKGHASVTFITPDVGAFVGLEQYSKKNYLKAWHVVSTDIISEVEITENYYDSYIGTSLTDHQNVINLLVTIKRNPQYYIYKIIIPVFLILAIAWLVLWIPIIPSQIESRLTTSIVALLALIAYNFVFNNDVPELSYLTNLDKYILVSYIFCAIPTFTTIILSRYVTNDQKKSFKINRVVRFWGIFIYFGINALIFSAPYVDKLNL